MTANVQTVASTCAWLDGAAGKWTHRQSRRTCPAAAAFRPSPTGSRIFRGRKRARVRRFRRRADGDQRDHGGHQIQTRMRRLSQNAQAAAQTPHHQFDEGQEQGRAETEFRAARFLSRCACLSICQCVKASSVEQTVPCRAVLREGIRKQALPGGRVNCVRARPSLSASFWAPGFGRTRMSALRLPFGAKLAVQHERPV